MAADDGMQQHVPMYLRVCQAAGHLLARTLLNQTLL